MYNPYDMVSMVINGKPTWGRPIQFDSDIVNQKTSTNAFGALVKPTQLSTTCPDCGQGLMVTVKFDDPPFKCVYSCSCKPQIARLVDPFINPILSQNMSPNELDPLLHNLNQKSAITNTVADRIDVETVLKLAAESNRAIVAETKKLEEEAKKKKIKNASKPKKSQPQLQEQLPPNPNDFIDHQAPAASLDKAEGLDEEFDDNDMLES